LFSVIRIFRCFALALMLSLSLTAHAQGCSMCRDTTAGSAPKVRQALRRAILILAIPAGGIFTGILLLARRMEPRED
jgi:hypothetical protein